MSLISEFKDFINRGNVMDMAVGVVVGGAFTAIVTSLTGDVVQPLVENSLKHGFRVGTLQSFPFAPMVTIAAVLGEECLELSVTDNGAGIDVEKARAAVRREGGEERGHVGLNNIYRRLCACYGEAEIDFSSVPFFENRVTIRVPARFFNGSEAQTP